MKQALPLGIAALASILSILLIVTVFNVSSFTGLVFQKHTTLSERLCPPGTVSVYRSSPPLYRGGPAEQLNVVCVSDDRPIEAEHGYFEYRPVPNFDRFRQDKLTRLYD